MRIRQANARAREVNVGACCGSLLRRRQLLRKALEHEGRFDARRGIKGGDQYVKIKVVVPAVKDDRSRELLEEFARLNPQDPRSGLPWS